MPKSVTISSDAVNRCDFNPDTEPSLDARAEWLIAMATKISMADIPKLSDEVWKAILNNAIAVQMFPAKIDSIKSLEDAVDAVRASHQEAKDMSVAAAMGVVEVLRTWWCEYTTYEGVELDNFTFFKQVVAQCVSSAKKKK